MTEKPEDLEGSEETEDSLSETAAPIGKAGFGEWVIRVGLTLKAIDSLFEVIGGALLFFPQKVAYWFYAWGAHELYRDHDVMAGRLQRLGDSIVTKASPREAGYLLVHGLAKVILIYGVYRGKKWGYLGLVLVLTLFSIIEIVRAITRGEVVVGLLAVIDIALVIYMAREYWKLFGNTTLE